MTMNTNINYQGHGNISMAKKTTIVRGILKKPEMRNQKKIRVRWEPDTKLEKVKIFKLTDDVVSPAVTEEEYQEIQFKILKNPNYIYLSDMRSKEIHMEKENMSKAREKSKMAKDILARMIPQMPWVRPYELKIPTTNTCNDDVEYDYESDTHPGKGTESEEKHIINALCGKILSVTYFRDIEIPDCPSMGISELFSFTDENIPKIENMKRAYNPDKPNQNSEIFEYIDNISETKLTPEIIQNISLKIQNKDFTQEEKNKILEYLTKHLHNKGIL
jgi:hypothetical protein